MRLPATYVRPKESAARMGVSPAATRKPTGVFHTTPVPAALSLATKREVSPARLNGVTYTPPLGSTAMVLTENPSLFCHSMVFPSADSLVTQEGVEPRDSGKVDRM